MPDQLLIFIDVYDVYCENYSGINADNQSGYKLPHITPRFLSV